MEIEEIVSQVEKIATFLDKREALLSPESSKRVVMRRAFNKLLGLPLNQWEEENMNAYFLRYKRLASEELKRAEKIVNPFVEINGKLVDFCDEGKMNELLVPKGYFYFSSCPPSGLLLARISDWSVIGDDAYKVELGEELVNTLSPAICGGYSLSPHGTYYLFHRTDFGRKIVANFILACKRGKNTPFPPSPYNRYFFLKGAEFLGVDGERLLQEKINDLGDEIELISKSLSQPELVHQASHLRLYETSPYVRVCKKIGLNLSQIYQDGELGEWIQEMEDCLVDLQKGGTYDFILDRNDWKAVFHLYLADTVDLAPNSPQTWNSLFHFPVIIPLLEREDDVNYIKEVIEDWRDALFDSIFKVYLTIRDCDPMHAYRRLVGLRENQREVLGEGAKIALSRLEQIVSYTSPLDKWL